MALRAVILALLYAGKKRSKVLVDDDGTFGLKGTMCSNCLFAWRAQHAQAEILCCQKQHLTAPAALGMQSSSERMLSPVGLGSVRGWDRQKRGYLSSIKKQPHDAQVWCHVGL